MGRGQLREAPAAGRGRHDLHAPPVGRVGPARGEAERLQAVHEPDRAVMVDLELLGQLPDGEPAAAPFERQQRVVLTGGEPGGGGRRLAEPQEADERVAEGGERRVLAGSDTRPAGEWHVPVYIVLRYFA
jgi:hypothetical protein